MSERITRIARREAIRANNAVAPSIQAALQNEHLTRLRVTTLESRLDTFEGMRRWEKLKWLFR